MGRAKIWGFTLLVLAAGGLNVYLVSQRTASAALERASASLRAGVAQLEAGRRLLARQAGDVAVLAARDPGLASAIAERAEEQRASRAARRPAPGPVDVGAAGEQALRAAARALDVDAARALLAVSSEQGSSVRLGDRALTGKEPVVQAALGGARHVRIDDALYVVGVAADPKGVTLAFGLPLEASWLQGVKASTGADATLSAEGKALASTLRPSEVPGVVSLARKAVGSEQRGLPLAPVKVPVNLAVPAVPLLLVEAPAVLARAVSLAAPDAIAVVSVSTQALLDPVGVYQQLTIAALLLLLLVGLVLGAIPERAVTAHVPRELASAADRLASGDFDVRVPRMSGTFGALALALNRTAEAARAARGPVAPGSFGQAPATPAATLDVPMLAVPPQEAPPPAVAEDPFAAAGMAPPGPPAPAPAPRNGAGSLVTPLPVPPQRTGTARFEAAEPLARQTPARVPAPVPAAAPPPAPAQAPAGGDEDGWQAVFQDFLRVREQCGEPLEGLTWERFRQKLAKNRDSLVQKYACRTVRFQVYVKEGKAALKATPVR
jgi:HAMP domain-containing protein